MNQAVPRPAAAREMARGGALSLVGSIVSAGAGFLFVIVLGRALGAEGSGLVMQAVAALTISLGVARAGLDTAAVWLLPRVRDGDASEIRPAVVGLLWPTFVLGLGAAFALVLLAPVLDPADTGLADALVATAWFLPAASMMTVALSATRGLGGLRAYVVIGSVGVPLARPLLVLATAAAGAGATAAAVAWAAPFPIAAVILILLLARRVRRLERRHGVRGRWLPHRELTRRTWGFALPRSLSTVLEQAMLWLDVVIVGVLAGPAAAGIYGAATRFVGAGLILSTSLRIVVAPLYSRMLGRGERAQVQDLYTMATQWVVLCSIPVYVLFACFGETVLSLVGESFRSGATALLILSLGLATVLLAGNVQSVLLMSGHSGWAAVNKVVAVVVDVVLLLVLVPGWGIEGAAVAWTLSMFIDAALAAFQVQRLIGVRVGGGPVATALAVGLFTFALPAVGARLWIGQSWLAFLSAALVGALLWTGTAAALRRRLQLAEVLHLFRRAPGVPAATPAGRTAP